MIPHALPPWFFLYRAAFGLQLPAVALFAAYALHPRRGLALAATALLGASLAVHLLFMAGLCLAAGSPPLSSGFEAVSAWGLALTALVVWVEARHRLGLLGSFLSPLSALTLLMGFRFAHSADVTVPGLGGGWLLAHVALATVGYACFTAAAGVAGAYLVQDRQLKNRRLGPLIYELPPLETLEALLARLAAAGLAALTLAVAAGFGWRLSLGLPSAQGDPKVAFSLAVIAAYAAALLARRRGPLRGRRFAWLCVALFVALFLGVYLVDLYLGGHAFLRPRGA